MGVLRLTGLFLAIFLSAHISRASLIAADMGAYEEHVPDFAVLNIFGEKGCDLKGASLQGLDSAKADLSLFSNKVVLVHFWATWCKPCKEEFPAIKVLHDRYRDKGLEVLTVSLDTLENTKKFMKESGVALHVVLDQYGELKRECKVSIIPYSVVLDRDERVKARIVGPREYTSSEAYRFFEKLLN